MVKNCKWKEWDRIVKSAIPPLAGIWRPNLIIFQVRKPLYVIDAAAADKADLSEVHGHKHKSYETSKILHISGYKWIIREINNVNWYIFKSSLQLWLATCCSVKTQKKRFTNKILGVLSQVVLERGQTNQHLKWLTFHLCWWVVCNASHIQSIILWSLSEVGSWIEIWSNPLLTMFRLALKEWVSAEMESHHLITEAWKGLHISCSIEHYYQSLTTIVIIIPLLLSLSSYTVLYG